MCIELNCFPIIQAAWVPQLDHLWEHPVRLWTGAQASPEHNQGVGAFMKEGEMLLALPLKGQMFREH